MNRKPGPNGQSEIVSATLVENMGLPIHGENRSADERELSLIERMLCPQSLQWMMASGGGLLVLGFALWLWSSGIFENPLVLAGTIGTLNLSILGLGVWCFHWTRFKLAGRGLTLLSSLVLPLNLWIYDSHGLIALENGEPLWIPALICCVIYGIVARLTRDAMFVYTLVGGIVLTGLLFLAGATTSPLWALLPIATFLVATAIMCIIADGLFVEQQGAFSREQFGLAFFRAGNAVLGGGLFFLAAGQVAHLASAMLLDTWSHSYVPLALATTTGKIWSMGILLGALLAYGYCQFSHRRHSLFSVMIVFTAVWILWIAAELLQVQITWNLAMLIFGAMLGIINLARQTTRLFVLNRHAESVVVSHAIPFAALMLVAVAVAPHFAILTVASTPMFRGAMNLGHLAIAAIACWTVPGVWRNAAGWQAKLSVVGGAVAVATALMTGAIGWGASPFLCLCMGVALAMVFAISLGFSSADYLHWLSASVAATTTALWWMMLTAGWMTFASGPSVLVATSLAMVALGVGYASGQRFAALHGGLMLVTAVIQLFVLFEITSAYSILPLVSCFGLSLLLLRKIVQHWQLSPHSNDWAMNVLEASGLVTVIVAALGSALFAISLIVNQNAVPALLGLQLFQIVPLTVAMLFTANPAWKRGLVAVATTSVVVALVVCSTLSELSLLRRAEIGSLLAGVGMVVYGYVGWSRETARTKDRVTFNLVMGSLLLLVPLAFGIAHDRFMGIAIGNPWRLVHEIGGLTMGLVLLGSGILCRIRSTTLAGAALLSTLVFSNLFLIGLPKHLLSTSFMLMIGGATFFAVAIILSVYRERLVKLPGKIRDGEGVFSVLKWR